MSGTSDLECNEILLVNEDGSVVTIGYSNSNSKCKRRIMSSESPRLQKPPDNRPSTPVKIIGRGKNKIKKRKTIRKKRKTIRKTRRKVKNLKKRKTM